MTLFHLSPTTGEPGPCSAEIKCPFGDQDQHYRTIEQARAAYEISMAGHFPEISPRAFQNEWFKGLADDELSSLSFFSKPTHHRSFNERLRAETLTEDDVQRVRGLDSALSQAPRGPELKVFRGLEITQGELDRAVKTGRLENKGYSSTSIKSKIAHLFAGQCDSEKTSVVLEFSTTMRSFLDLGEGEILLPRDLTLKIENVDSDETGVYRLVGTIEANDSLAQASRS